MNTPADARSSFCVGAFRAWFAGGALALVLPGALGATTPAGPLAAWLVAMPLACLVLLEPCLRTQASRTPSRLRSMRRRNSSMMRR